jgi:uncharacterized protein (DUF1778 family)
VKDTAKFILESPALLAAAAKQAQKPMSQLVAEAAAKKAEGKLKKKGK